MASLRLLTLAFVRRYITEHGGSPSYGEIAAGLNTSRMNAYRAVKRLARDGMILRQPGPRGLSLPEQRDEAIRVLRDAGWTVLDDAARVASAGPVTNQILPRSPVLDYVPPQGGGGDGDGAGQ